MGGVDIQPGLAMVAWHPAVGPALFTALLAGLLVSIWGGYRRLRQRVSARRAALLLAPRCVAALLLVAVLLGPAWQVATAPDAARRVLVLVDRSASMDVRDQPPASRAERARAALAQLSRDLGRRFDVRPLEFDTALRAATAAPPASTEPRGTDIGACLLELAARRDPADAVLLLTDGGDEKLADLTLPPAPIVCVGFGTDPETWRDTAIEDVAAPDSVEKGVDFEIRVDLLRRRAAGHAAGDDVQTLTLERLAGTQWARVDAQRINLANLRAAVTFRTACPDEGLQRFRVALQPLRDELSALNNGREFAVDVRRKALHVLFYTRSLTPEIKAVRNELATDAGIVFTALYRTMGERFTVQGDGAGDADAFASGLPADTDRLRRFDCIILGSFPAREWSPRQAEALVRYAEQGGTVVFLGGEDSFGRGGYAASPLAPLFPWTLALDEPEMSRSRAYVSVPAAAESSPVMAGVAALLARAGQPAVESANVIGGLRPGATALLNGGVAGRTLALVAVQRYGNGHALAIASNTFWKWGLESGALKAAYGLFWRQAVRNLSGRVEGTRLFSVTWDKRFYRPGEKATAEVRLTGAAAAGERRFAAEVAGGAGVATVPVDPIQGQAGAFAARPAFPTRGTYRFALSLFEGQGLLDKYERHIQVAPRLGEGARLELNLPFLNDLARRSGGLCVREGELGRAGDFLRARDEAALLVSERAVAHDSPHLALALVLCLVLEWALRRMMNLL